jgi:hypothetical protein
MTAPNTRNWTASEFSDLVGRHTHVEVHGEVETGATNLLPKLKYRVPQGFNPRILLLDLTIESQGGLGGQVVMYRKAEYSRPTSGNDYDEVDIFFEGEIIERIKVAHPMTFARTKPAGTPAKKKPAKKKTSKKSAGKAAKKKKSAAKKSAKKASKAKKAKKKKAARKKK